MEFIAEAEDDRGQRARASYSVWPASGEDAWFDAADHDRIDIIPDKTEYQPGERARFQVRMPFRRATAWVAIERGGVLDTRVIELDRPEFELDIARTGHRMSMCRCWRCVAVCVKCRGIRFCLGLAPPERLVGCLLA